MVGDAGSGDGPSAEAGDAGAEGPAALAGLACHLDLECEHAPLLVHAVRGREEISHAYRYEIDFSTTALDTDKVLRTGARLQLTNEQGMARLVAGSVEGISLTSAPNGRLRCRAVVVPTMSLLSHCAGFAIFQELSVPDIVK